MQLISLTTGELTGDTYLPVIQAGVSAIAKGQTHYAPIQGVYDLRVALAKLYQKDSAEFGPENILVTAGVRQAVFNVLTSLIEPGDEVILCTPYWFAFPELLKQCGAVVRLLETTLDEDFKIETSKIEALITDKTKLFIFNNPNNPSGKVYISREIEDIAEVLVKYPQINILSDEIYEFINYGYDFLHFGSWQTIADRVITVSGFSKTFAMAGWRIGYVAASEKFIQKFTSFQEVSLSGVPVFTQMAALKALETKEDYLPDLMAELKLKRERAWNYITEMPGVKCMKPEGAYYFYPDISAFFGKVSPKGRHINNVNDLVGYLFAEYRLQVFSGAMFGHNNHIRLSFSMSVEVVEEAYSRLQKALLALS